MLKPIPNLNTILAAPLSNVSAVAEVAQAGADLLRSKLGLGDWVYAVLNDGINYEVIKITGIAENIVALERAIDGTVAGAFGAGTSVVYTLGIAAMTDVAVGILLTGGNITGTGIVKVTDNGNGNFNIHADPIQLVSGDPDITVTSLYPNYAITKN